MARSRTRLYARSAFVFESMLWIVRNEPR